ncbi:protein-glutamate methylesterase/protein-glutamine glutaminase [Texcoconibacillus texcoconensis]|uniref:Protein-glutamate methylesterase/protein-glutamine glutaminase n=1 Tax=Texcoconibacillus texcoconensis TaxID=1095777 RepID=A0A840QKQ7_9BACI|nr:chemotaxis response regulator protein-glutamate methylesterase [Texcoconibacillus texcoconensis]MBB5172057.1 two-component system chemotaxis response regulator CheB [Texcoconibacillus texcoconensis]
MTLIHVLVVDDSAFMRRMISDILESDERLTVIGTARNGEDALKKQQQLNPDVITLDVEMPVMDGLTTLQEIMKVKPVPVIMVSSTTKEGADTTMKAIAYGAIDFIAKPSGAISLDIDKISHELIEKTVLASTVVLEKLADQRLEDSTPNEDEKKTETDTLLTTIPSQTTRPSLKKIVAIGTSTGGPKALQKVLSSFSENIDAPIIIVQHMPKGFTASLSKRLNSVSKILVKEAEEGDILQKGVAYIAPGGYHLTVRSIGTSVAIQLDQSLPVNGHRPSVDKMFNSLTGLSTYLKIAVVLTGMGSDGKEGLHQLKRSGETIAIAESHSSSVVYGMPRSVIEAQLSDHTLDIKDISLAIERYCT